MDEIHVHKTKKSICAHFAESPCSWCQPDSLNAKWCSVSKNSCLRKLCPILVQGLICVGGRLQRSPFSLDVKHPIILPKKHHVTHLIINFFIKKKDIVGCNILLQLQGRRSGL